MTSIRACDVPADALHRRYQEQGAYTDCYVVEVPRPVTHAEFVEAFYTTGVFKLERLVLSWFLSRPSTDAEARELASGRATSFAAWTVEAREANQILMCDMHGRTRSWLMTVPSPDGRSTKLYFGSAVVLLVDKRSGERKMGFGFRALLGFHKVYSHVLLRAAVRRLARPGPSAPGAPTAEPARTDNLGSLERHIAGATVQHQGPFASLEVPAIAGFPPPRICGEWVDPLYFGFDKPHVEDFMRTHGPMITDGLIRELLSYFDWRSRIVGAQLAALQSRTEFTDHIGRLLLRSDVCYAGSGYCLALAEFNNAESVAFLRKYLDYYLSRVDLQFDQGDAIAALHYLDRLNGTNFVSEYVPAWEAFTANKSNWSLQKSIDGFDERMQALHLLRAACKA